MSSLSGKGAARRALFLGSEEVFDGGGGGGGGGLGGCSGGGFNAFSPRFSLADKWEEGKEQLGLSGLLRMNLEE